MLVAFLEETEKLEADKKSNVSSDADVFFFFSEVIKTVRFKGTPFLYTLSSYGPGGPITSKVHISVIGEGRLLRYSTWHSDSHAL